MNATLLSQPHADMLQRYLDLQSQQMHLTASNMANVDTPGYQTQGINFDREFQQALDAHAPVREAAPSDVTGLIARPDGNNVSMDREAMQMAQTQLQFRTAIALLRNEFSTMSDAIKSDGR